MSRCIQPPCRVELARDCLVFPGRDEVIRLNTAGQLGLGERCLVPVREEGLCKVRSLRRVLRQSVPKSRLQLAGHYYCRQLSFVGFVRENKSL